MSHNKLNYIVNHIFFPPKLPQEDDHSHENDQALCFLLLHSAHIYQASLPMAEQIRWDPMIKLLQNLCDVHESEILSKDHVKAAMERMRPGDVLALLIRAQNAGVILRKFEEKTIFEAFEVSPPNEVVMAAKGKLLCSYPGPAVSFPTSIFEDAAFREEFASYVVQMNIDILDSAATTTKAKSTVVEERNTAHPRYITDLLTQILLGMGEAIDVSRIQKRIADDILWKDAFKPWRRSPLWLVIRVALQTSLYNITGDHVDYKSFMVIMMGEVLRNGVDALLSSDLLFCMRAKMSRRLFKLGASAPSFVALAVQEVGEITEKLLQGRWRNVQEAQTRSTFWETERLDLSRDTLLSLHNSSYYISTILDRLEPQNMSSEFSPESFRRFHDLATFDPANLDLLSRAFEVNPHIALADFELAVQEHLDDWVTSNLYDSSASATMAACITQYSTTALLIYKSDPQGMSLMSLTLFELWVALDKVTVAQCPLLMNYSPEVPPKLLKSLLLCRLQPLVRATNVEQYLLGRHAKAHTGNSIFTDTMDQSSFAVCYFTGEHQLLKSRIEADARTQRDAKLAELNSKNDSHRRLMAESNLLSHSYQFNRRGKEVHSTTCRKCSLEKEASCLRIRPHEWPLPENVYEAQTVVFELCPPPAFQIWRDTTFAIFYDICSKGQDSRARPSVHLGNYGALQKYPRSKLSRISLASGPKSFSKSHYKNKKIPSLASAVCLNNALQFRLHDSLNDVWAAAPFKSCDIATYCTLRLVEGPYRPLQYAVDGTSHTSNEVIARQSECSKDLTLHEYYAFAVLRGGPRLQWLNIARELPARSLSFHKEEVHTLITQAAWQIGPLVDGTREWHAELRDPIFGKVLLQELHSLLVSIEASWLEGVAVRTIIMLTNRLLASAPRSTIVEKACQLLLEARRVTFRWVCQLVEKLQDSEDEAVVQEFQWRVCEMAAICRSTFDPDHATFLLVSTQDVEILIRCAILVNDNSPPATTNPELSFKTILDRDRRLSHLLEPMLREQIRRNRDGLDLAIVSVWAAYRPGSEWCNLEAPNDSWFTTGTAIVTGHQEPQCVQFNLLDGRLLINGKLLSRLPLTVVNHPTYSRVLGRKVLDIVPADCPGMDYATRSLIYDYQVLLNTLHSVDLNLTLDKLLFSMPKDSTDLVIRTRRGMEILELIPYQKLYGDLPKLLVENYTHWLNISTYEIELRPLNNIWKSSAQNWRIQYSSDGLSKMTMHRQSRSRSLLVDIRSPTFRMLSSFFLQLEHAEYMTITCSSDYLSVNVDLPRFRLSFFLNDRRRLESHNWPGMVVDSCQSTGTMFGLRSQLVLCQERQELSQPRRVIIPWGKVHARRDGHGAHVDITVDTGLQAKVKYHEYTIDTDLRRLRSKTLEAKLFKVYLHALSGHCLPDPLTGRTGTQEALHDFRSAGCISFQALGAAEIEILLQIRSLTPERAFYPAHLKVMQTVHWSDLLSSAQHHGFSVIAETIIQYAGHMRSIAGQPSPESWKIPELCTSLSLGGHLSDRASRRTAIFYAEETTGLPESPGADLVYASRDVPSSVDPDIDVTDISCMVHHWPARLITCRRLMDVFQQWESISGFNDEVDLSYSRQWLDRDLAESWISLYRLCCQSSRGSDRFRLQFSLSAMAFTCSSQYRSLIPTILAFATIPKFCRISPPSASHYHLAGGFAPQREKLMQIILDSATVFEQSSDAYLPALPGEEEVTLGQRRYSSFVDHRDSQVTELVDQLLSQWPSLEPRVSYTAENGDTWLFNVAKLTESVKPLFQSCYQNVQFRYHIQGVQKVLDEVHLTNTEPIISRSKFTPCTSRSSSAVSAITFDWLLKRNPPTMNFLPPIIPDMPVVSRQGGNLSVPDSTGGILKPLLSEFERSTNPLHQQYGRDLDSSLQSFDGDLVSHPAIPPLALLSEHLGRSIEYFENILSSVYDSLSPSNIVESAMLTAGQWPCITTTSLLEMLAYPTNLTLPDSWRRTLVQLAQALLVFQRSRRLLYFARTENDEELSKELANSDYNDHDNVQYLDWLLIQVESNFCVRPIQVQVAHEMIAPSSRQNTALQLNMGEGKSSVIVPMVSTALANGRTLVRVVVLKSLSSQMFRLLVDRLSGLSNRRIFYLPFSRSIKLDAQQVQRIQNLNVECMRVGGILVAQPEHILSFKLMCVDETLCATSSADRKVATALVKSQRWSQAYSRDIIDESDEVLHVRYQLVYTVGQQRTLEGHPDRWTTVQQVFSVVKREVLRIQEIFPLGVEVQQCELGQFPSIRILHVDAGAALVSSVTQAIVRGGLRNYSFSLLGERVCKAALSFISELGVPDGDVKLLREKCEGTNFWNGLLLLRGLLAHGILVYVLKARHYRVDYGLDQSRSLLAVPYRAKDVPSLRAEFGHPDVAISLTCLSYYYQGLSEDQLVHCFELLYKLDNPTAEYEDWVFHDDSITPELRQLSGVNTRDHEQWERYVFPLFHCRQAVVNFFLSQVVFPKEAKEFPKKLATSGWDIAETKTRFTTGFSGTNDNRYLLPTSIVQDDPVKQLSTNAKVLSYLLQPENNRYLCTNRDGFSRSTESFLELLVTQTPEIRVLLDVGAQMLDLQNEKLAERWLSLVPDIPAVVFFGANDELAVLTRDGTLEPFVSSPFSQQPGKCLVYLDDAHTRGTDLKLPRDYRAAVTLGPKVTKDRLLQGCMRMRMLGYGQSVMFFAPLEVDRKIREIAKISHDAEIEPLDILRWAMTMTCADIQHHIPHWAQQGIDYKSRNQAWRSFCADVSSAHALGSSWLQVEARSLEDMYGLSRTTDGSSEQGQQVHAAFAIPELRDRCRELGIHSFSNPVLEEEQEREVNHEVEKERQVQRPPKAEPAKHEIHREVLTLIKTGIISHQSKAFAKPFDSLKDSSPFHDVWSPYLRATADFLKTVQGPISSAGDYLRPVHWIVSSFREGKTLLVALSPYEVNELLPEIRRGNKVYLHQYSARVTQNMKSFDDLMFYCLPRLPSSWVSPPIDLRNELNLWAGQLFFGDFETYLRFCNFLGIYTDRSPSDITVQADGFIRQQHRHSDRISLPHSLFKKSPLLFLQRLIGLRRKGMGYSSTHMGKILHAKLLTQEDFQ